MRTKSEPVSKLPPLLLERVITMREATELTSLSAETLERVYPQWVLRLSPKRKGMKLKNVLRIAEGETKPAA
jgi:hypothetical protein